VSYQVICINAQIFWEDGEWMHQRTSTGFATFYYEMYEDKHGDIWAGTSTVTGYIEKLTLE
jgi:hypothetical protein